MSTTACVLEPNTRAKLRSVPLWYSTLRLPIVAPKQATSDSDFPLLVVALANHLGLRAATLRETMFALGLASLAEAPL